MSLYFFDANRLGRFESGHLGLYISVDSIIDPDNAARAVEHINLLGETANKPVGLRHEEFFKSSLPQERGRLAATFSLFAHEMRHFHDVILTPYGSFLMRQAVQINIAYLIKARLDIAVLCDQIYVPLQDWVDNYNILSVAYPNLAAAPQGVMEYVSFWRNIHELLAIFERGNPTAPGSCSRRGSGCAIPRRRRRPAGSGTGRPRSRPTGSTSRCAACRWARPGWTSPGMATASAPARPC
jgi:hypothetical protein